MKLIKCSCALLHFLNINIKLMTVLYMRNLTSYGTPHFHDVDGDLKNFTTSNRPTQASTSSTVVSAYVLRNK